ncbi:restriction endonuclease subunit S [Prevotella intermedia]|uniref:Restriction endonuclease subunit S n=1 Tax=Prevotella intermedia TaxID=28131 RepID=A0A2M8M3T4_PREIN|nr:restriction endonuclease subunit S [Prevotella intermedia]PJE98864.1 restriction endonuclease subunit S [Prevotella intermedia]
MNGKQLKNSILQWAIQGKLVPQDPNDEPASVLLEKIRLEKERLIKEKKIKRDKNASIIYRGEDNSYYEKFIATGMVKCIDEEIPFEIPQGWEWCRLGEISTYAQTKKKINAANADVQLWGLDLEDIKKGGKLLYRKTVGERKAIGDKTIFNRGDILYSKLRPYLLKVLIAPESGICTPEIIPFTCYGNICKEYIVSLLKSPYVDDYINAVTYGVKMPRVGTETMTSLLVPFPPISEQLRIVAKTEQLMKYVDEYEKIQDKLDCLNEELPIILRKSLLQEAIQGKLVPQIELEGTAQELHEQIKSEKQSLVKEGKLKKSALTDSVIFKGDDNKYYEQVDGIAVPIESDYDFPSTWEVVRLSHICRLIDGEKKEGQYICLDAKYLRGKSTGNKLIKGKFVNKGDNIILVDGENSGEVFTVPHDGYMGSTFKQLWVSSRMYLPYVLYIIQFYKNLLRNSKKGAAIPHLNKDIFYSLLIGIPPYQEQERIANAIGELYAPL